MTVINFILALLPEFFDYKSWGVGEVGGIIGAVTGVGGLGVAVWPIYQQHRRQKLLDREFGAELYQPAQIENAARYYVKPYCSSVDPAQEEEMRRTFMTKEKLFTAIDRYITEDTSHRHILLLADAGMGKSSFVLSYYARNQQLPRRKQQRLAVIPLGRPGALEEIAKIDNQKHTVLFLDAFDEDTLAIPDYHARLQGLMTASSRFKRVLITCRTQFFRKDDEIPQQTGIARVEPRKPGEGNIYEFWKLYLLPLDEEQIEEYICRRYRFWTWRMRRQARAAVNKVPLLSVRPMLLAYLPDLLQGREVELDFSVQLYEQMVKKWVERERHWFENYDLLGFSKEIAVDLYVNSARRRSERINREELGSLLQAHPIPIDEWKITGRSLLNRDGSGNYKFSHRSIMEYLFVVKFLEGDARCRDIKWTDLMKQFLLEFAHIHYSAGQGEHLDLTGADLTDTEDIHVAPIYRLRSSPMTVAEPSYQSLQRADLPAPVVHIFAVQRRREAVLVTDHAAGLTWQQDGPAEMMTCEAARRYVQTLNSAAYCGYSDWRLPTAEELIQTITGGGLDNAPFDRNRLTFWTGDQTTRGDGIYLQFTRLRAETPGATAYVNAVRSLPSASAGIN